MATDFPHVQSIHKKLSLSLSFALCKLQSCYNYIIQNRTIHNFIDRGTVRYLQKGVLEAVLLLLLVILKNWKPRKSKFPAIGRSGIGVELGERERRNLLHLLEGPFMPIQLL